uniref:SHSP domain-containing protein n=1 Tax=Cannabis sativa TaxID=3483 RepID=A0A803NGT5_CANSA
MSGWMMQKKEVELKGFIKVFRIPDGVILDRIKAKFNNQESVLTIVIPKSSKGIRGVGIEEVKEEEVVNKDETDHATTSEEQTHKIMPRTEELKVEEKIEGAHDVFDEMSKRNETRIEPEIITNEETFQEIKPTQPLPSEEEAKRKELPEIKEETCEEGLEPVHVIEENKDEDKECSSSCGGDDDESAMVEKQEAIEEKGKDKASGGSSRRIKLCVPCVIAGSTIIVSIVVFAVHWIRTKKREVH